MAFKTSQEEFWAGDFGDAYNDRNKGENLLATNLNIFSQILKTMPGANSLVELGANIGMNLDALHLLAPSMELSAVEINQKASEVLKEKKHVKKVFQGRLLDWKEEPRDVALIKGVLSHQNPDDLPEVYRLLDRSSKKYVVIVEYYNPSPVTVQYRGNTDKLFKRDFAGEFMEMFPNYKLRHYQFFYRRDPLFPADDITAFILEKNA